PAHATEEYEASELGGKVLVVPTTLPCAVKGPVLTATAGTSSPGLGALPAPANRQRFSLGHATSVGSSPRPFCRLAHEIAWEPGGPPGLVSQLGWVVSGRALAP